MAAKTWCGIVPTSTCPQARLYWIEILKPPNPKLDAKDQNQICLVGTKIEMANCKRQRPDHGVINESTDSSKRGSCSSNASDSPLMDITDFDNKESEAKLKSNQKIGRNKWSSAKKYHQKLSTASKITSDQNVGKNQASNSSDDTHETQDLNSVQPKIESKEVGKKFNKQDITDFDNKESKAKLQSNQKIGRNKWSSAKKYPQKLSTASKRTSNQNIGKNQASNSMIPHETQDLLSTLLYLKVSKAKS